MSREHRRLAARLRDAVLGRNGLTEPALRLELLEGGSLDGAIGRLAEQIRRDATRVTDADVQAVVEETGSEKAAFEVVVTASAGAALARWNAAVRAIDGAWDAAR